MSKLHQVIPAVAGQAKITASRITEVHHALKTVSVLTGHRRTFQPFNDEGVQYADDTAKVQILGYDALATARAELVKLIDVTATRDEGNTHARADIKVGDEVLAPGVPATTLLWLEKQLDDLYTLVSKLPTLPADKDWTWDDQERVFRAEATRTVKSKKVQKVLTLAPATERHPAQAQMVTEDEPEGTWTTVALSGAFRATEVRVLIDRVAAVRAAVKAARADANEAEVEQVTIGASILDYVFRGDAV